jgi:hypothetical protein
LVLVVAPNAQLAVVVFQPGLGNKIDQLVLIIVGPRLF